MSNLEPLFFRVIEYNNTTGLRPNRCRTALHERVRLLAESITRLKYRVDRGDSLELPIADSIGDLLFQIATTYGRLQLAVPVRWEMDHTRVTHELIRRSSAVNHLIKCIEKCFSALEVLSGLNFAEVYVAIQAVLHQLTCHVVELSYTLNIKHEAQLERVVGIYEEARDKLLTG